MQFDIRVAAADAHAADAYAHAAAAAYPHAARADAAYAAAADDAAYAVIGADAIALEEGVAVMQSALWTEATPEWFVTAESEMLKLWRPEPTRWAFWDRWWKAGVEGKPLNPQLQLAIVEGVDDETWKDPDAVAARIVEITASRQIEAAIRANPHAWRVSLDPKTGQFCAEEIERRDMSTVVDDVKEAIKDFNARCKKLNISNFGQAVEMSFEPPMRLLKKDLRTYADQPYKLYRASAAARKDMQTIARAEGFAGESYITRFFDSLDDFAEDICVASPEVVETLKQKLATRFDLYTMERRREMMHSAFGLHLDAEGMLERASFEALRTLLDDTASKNERKDAFCFCEAVLPRAARAYLSETQETGEAPKPTEKSLLERSTKVADTLNKLDKGVDALQENIPEMYEGARGLIENYGNLPF